MDRELAGLYAFTFTIIAVLILAMTGQQMFKFGYRTSNDSTIAFMDGCVEAGGSMDKCYSVWTNDYKLAKGAKK